MLPVRHSFSDGEYPRAAKPFQTLWTYFRRSSDKRLRLREPQPIWGADFFVPINIPRSLRNQTVRQIATISLGGTRVRVVLSNEYRSEPLVVGAAHVAVAGQGGAIVAGSDRALTFSGQPSVTIPPGAPVISDPVELKVEPLSEVAVSLFSPEITPLTTFHWEGVQTAYISPEGNFVSDTEMKTDSTIKSRLFLSGIMVDAPAGARAIVTFGDSITDGADSTPDANHRTKRWRTRSILSC